MLIDLLLGLVGLTCCLGVPSLLAALPLALAARAVVQRHPGARVPIVFASAVAGAFVTGGALGLCGVAAGLSIGDESAGAALELLALGGLAGGAFAGLLVTPALTALLTRRPSERPPAAPSPLLQGEPPGPAREAEARRRGAWMLGASFGVLVLGVATTLVGMVLSVSLGWFSLAFAALVIRPLAVIFVALHLLTGAAALLTERRGAARAWTRSALAVALVGALLAAGIAAMGPGFLGRMMSGGMRGLLASGVRAGPPSEERREVGPAT